jgi:hypothetical protein
MDFKSLLSKLDVIGSKKNLNEGWDDMMKASKEKEKEKGTGKFDKKETSTGTVYTRKSSTFDDGGDDKDTKKAKEKAKKAKVKEGEEKVDEDDVEEGNEFSGARDAAVKAGKKEFTVGGKTYPVKESKKPDDDDDGVPNWADKKPGEDDNADKKKAKKKVAEAEEKCDDCGKPTDDCECDDHDHEDKDDDKDDDKKKVDESLQECYDQAMGQMQSQQESGMNISSNMDTKTGNQSLTVTAQGPAADELAQLLKLSGILGGHDHSHSNEIEVSMEEGEYANKPNTQMQGIDAQIQQGNDLNRPKATHPKVAGGDNPLQRAIATMEAKAQSDIEALEKKLMEQLESLKVVTKK